MLVTILKLIIPASLDYSGLIYHSWGTKGFSRPPPSCTWNISPMRNLGDTWTTSTSSFCWWMMELSSLSLTTQHLEETHSCCLHQRCRWFGHKHYPELMAIGERRKADRPVTEPFHFHALASFQPQSIQNKNNSKSINHSSLLPSLINKIQRYLNSSNWSSRSFPQKYLVKYLYCRFTEWMYRAEECDVAQPRGLDKILFPQWKWRRKVICITCHTC